MTLTAKGSSSLATSRASVVVEAYDWQATASRRAAPFDVASMSCANPDDCVLASFNGDAAHLTNAGGLTWTNVDNTLPSAPETGLASVSCVPGSKDFCVALDYGGNYVTFDGTTWSSPTPLYDTSGLTARAWRIDCLAIPLSAGGGNQCLAIDGAAHDHVYTATFQATTTVSAASVPLSGSGRIACATTVLCVAVDPRGRASVLSNGIWSPPQVLDPVGTVLAVACAPDHDCVLTDEHSNVVDFSLRGGKASGIASHSVYSILHHSSIPRSVTCAMSYCLVGLDDGHFLQHVHGSWFTVGFSASMLPHDRLDGISCATSSTNIWCASTSDGEVTGGSHFDVTMASGAVRIVG